MVYALLQSYSLLRPYTYDICPPRHTNTKIRPVSSTRWLHEGRRRKCKVYLHQPTALNSLMFVVSTVVPMNEMCEICVVSSSSWLDSMNT
eukprot:238515-Pyramimonas_sp.AAC.1